MIIYDDLVDEDDRSISYENMLKFIREFKNDNDITVYTTTFTKEGWDKIFGDVK